MTKKEYDKEKNKLYKKFNYGNIDQATYDAGLKELKNDYAKSQSEEKNDVNTAIGAVMYEEDEAVAAREDYLKKALEHIKTQRKNKRDEFDKQQGLGNKPNRDTLDTELTKLYVLEGEIKSELQNIAARNEYFAKNPDKRQLKLLKKAFGATDISNSDFILGNEKLGIKPLLARDYDEYYAAYTKAYQSLPDNKGKVPPKEEVLQWIRQLNTGKYDENGEEIEPSLETKWLRQAQYAKDKEDEPIPSAISEFVLPWSYGDLEKGNLPDKGDAIIDIGTNVLSLLPYGLITKGLSPTGKAGRIAIEALEQGLVPVTENTAAAMLGKETPSEAFGRTALGTLGNYGIGMAGKTLRYSGERLDPYGTKLKEAAAKKARDKEALDAVEGRARAMLGEEDKKSQGIKSLNTISSEQYGFPDATKYGFSSDDAKRLYSGDYEYVPVERIGMENDIGGVRRNVDKSLRDDLGTLIHIPKELAEKGDQKTIGNWLRYHTDLKKSADAYSKVNDMRENFTVKNPTGDMNPAAEKYAYKKSKAKTEASERAADTKATRQMLDITGDEDIANIVAEGKARGWSNEKIAARISELISTRKKNIKDPTVSSMVTLRTRPDIYRRALGTVGVNIPMVVPGIRSMVGKLDEEDDRYSIDWYGK